MSLTWLSEYIVSFLLSELRAMKKCPKSIRFLSKLYAKSGAAQNDQIEDTRNAEKNKLVNGKS
jgi:hypothetical protein